METRFAGEKAAPDTPLVSIVVVAYNNWPDLELAIESALCQSYTPIEVIVVDNSSTDGTPHEVSRRFADRIRYVRQANRGDAGAYNAGMSVARGEFVQFLDGDDVLTPYKIEKQMEVFRSEPDVDIVYGDTRLFKAREGNELLKDTATRAEKDLLAVFLKSSGDYFGNPLGFLLRRTALERVGPWDESIYVTDADYWLRSLLAGCRFRHCRDALMGFLRVGPGKMSSNTRSMQRGQEALWMKALEHVTREPYRAMILRNLAETRFLQAIRGDRVTTVDALKKLSEARATSRTAVPFLAYAAAAAVLLIPGGHALACSPRFRTPRRAVARMVGYRIAD